MFFDSKTIKDAEKYRCLRQKSLEQKDTLGGLFVGQVPQNLVLNGEDLDRALEKEMEDEWRGQY